MLPGEQKVGGRRFLMWMAIPAVLLAGVTLWGGYIYVAGDDVLLETVPVDPTDLFRGQYMQLAYKIGTLNTDFLHTTGGPFRGGDTVYVMLLDEGRFDDATAVARNRDELGGDLPCIKGQVQSARDGVLRVEYGIESYFFEEGSKFPEGRREITVLIRVSPLCDAAIKQLYVDGEKWP